MLICVNSFETSSCLLAVFYACMSHQLMLCFQEHVSMSVNSLWCCVVTRTEIET